MICRPIPAAWALKSPATPRRIRAPTAATSTRSTGGTKTKKSARGKPAASESHYSGDIRTKLEVAGIVLALVLLGGFIAYQFWPASEDYLYRKAGRVHGLVDPG